MTRHLFLLTFRHRGHGTKYLFIAADDEAAAVEGFVLEAEAQRGRGTLADGDLWIVNVRRWWQHADRRHDGVLVPALVLVSEQSPGCVLP